MEAEGTSDQRGGGRKAKCINPSSSEGLLGAS